ncbi:MAG: iron uptake porin [Kamptonema sp. SIO4C4]|nr:iron uptake porin [Kamptonema sp. SIO4C4]
MTNTASSQLDSLEELAQAGEANLSNAEQSDRQIAQTNPNLDIEATPVENRSNNAPNANEILEQINRYGTEDSNGSLGQGVPGAAQFTDVSPNDWAFQALDDLVRRYDCLKGYPDGTYRGNRSLSRYEFAAGLNACLQQIERLIAASTADFVTRADLETLQRLIQEFEAELATLGTRVDNLEGRVAFLEDHQFSTTTKLSGEVIMALTNEFDIGSDNDAEDNVGNTLDAISESAFGDRVRLELNTSFTGNDRLVTRLTAGNLEAFDTVPLQDPTLGALNGTESFSSYQSFNIGENNNDVDLDLLAYYFPFGNSQAYVSATGGTWSDIVPTLNPYFEDFDGGDGALSTFAQRNPIFRIGGGSGAALSFGFSPIESILGPSTVTLGYLAGSNAADPGAGRGFLNGDYAVLGNLNANVSDTIGLGLTYVHAYHASESPIFAEGEARNPQTGLVGSYLANNPWVLLDDNADNRQMVTNSFGAQFAFRPSSKFVVNGSITWTDVTMLRRGDADIWTYALGVALPDFGKEGNVLGFYGGMQPTLRGIEALGVNDGVRRVDDVWHIEGFYKYQLTNNISITPGVIWVINPNQNFENDSNIIGTLRTTFSF